MAEQQTRADRSPLPRERTNELAAETSREERIAVAAYYNAEREGFQKDREMDYWLEAEAQIDSMAAGSGVKHEAALAAAQATDTSVEIPSAGSSDPEPERIEANDVKRIAKELGVSAARLRVAIQRVGPILEDVKQFLQNPEAK